jgi:hypothetical protein
MVLQRSLRKTGSSLAITLLSRLDEMGELHREDNSKIEIIGRDGLRLCKAEGGHRDG